jgi:DNA-binding NtrC family response regulator
VDQYWHKPGTEEEVKLFLKGIQSLLERKSSLPPRKRPLRIVILDDEETCRESYRVMLQGWYEGIVVVQCHAGDKAWEELSRTEPDLLITDHAHPGMSCHEMLERLAARKAKFPIFLISAGAFLLPEAALRSARENLNFSSWDKPLDVYQFRQALETALRMPAQQEP